MKNVVCPGCGLTLSAKDAEMDKEFNASHACRELVYKVSYYSLSLQDEYFIHQLVVDAYAAQHTKSSNRPITIFFPLVGLYLVNERGFSGKQVQNVHVTFAKKWREWPLFEAPRGKASLTVSDVLHAPLYKRPEMIKKWVAAVWDIWKPQHEKIKEEVEKRLNIS